MTTPENDLLGPDDHQGIGVWAERGLLNSDERESAERAAVAEADDAEPGPSAPVDETVPDLGGKPGSFGEQGDEAEHAAFKGDGVYSGGQFAGSDLTTPTSMKGDAAT